MLGAFKEDIEAIGLSQDANTDVIKLNKAASNQLATDRTDTQFTELKLSDTKAVSLGGMGQPSRPMTASAVSSSTQAWNAQTNKLKMLKNKRSMNFK